MTKKELTLCWMMLSLVKPGIVAQSAESMNDSSQEQTKGKARQA